MMKSSISLMVHGMCVIVLGLILSACNTTKATMDTTGKFFSSTSPEDLFSADGYCREGSEDQSLCRCRV